MEYKAQQLKKDLITKRCIENDMTMDEASKQIGISKATLSRLEKLKLPDVETLGKVCTWLGTEPNDYFSIPSFSSKLTDEEIMELFFNMLKRNGVNVIEEYDEGKEFTIISCIPIGCIGNPENRTVTFCVDKEGEYSRIMGYVGSFFSDEIHKLGWS